MTDRVEQIISQLAALIAELPEAYRAALLNAAANPPARPVPTTATARFRACVAVVLKNEGGFVDNPADPGGATNMGITRATLQDWRNADVDAEDVRNLTLDEARQIYEARYWVPNRCDQMAPGVDLAVFDFAVNSGGAVRAIQKRLGVTPDGAVGPLTLSAMALFEPSDLVERICDLRLVYLRGLATWEDFGRGWTNRVGTVRQKALAMARGLPVAS